MHVCQFVCRFERLQNKVQTKTAAAAQTTTATAITATTITTFITTAKSRLDCLPMKTIQILVVLNLTMPTRSK